MAGGGSAGSGSGGGFGESGVGGGMGNNTGTEFEGGPGFTGSADFGGAFGGTGAPASAGGAGGGFWDAVVQAALQAMSQAHPAGVVPGVIGAGLTAKARGLPNEAIENAMVMASPLGQALSIGGRATKGLADLLSWAGATGGPQPGFGAMPGGVGTGGVPDYSGLAASVFGGPDRPVDMGEHGSGGAAG